jgi:gas vesicle protein
MNDAPDNRGTTNIGSTLIGFALGAAIGAGFALLMAPDSGKRTRERLASTARRLGEGAGHTLEQARDTVSELGADAKSAIKAGQAAFLHDRATRESHSERQLSHSANTPAGHNAFSRSRG